MTQVLDIQTTLKRFPYRKPKVGAYKKAGKCLNILLWFNFACFLCILQCRYPVSS